MVKSVGIFALALLTFGASSVRAQQLSVGAVAPVVSVPDLQGHAVNVGLHAGRRAAVVEFWATWCEICQALLPEMERAHTAYGDRVDFYGVNVTVNDPRNHVIKYVADHHLPFATVYDGRGVAVRAFGAVATSHVVIVGPDGKVAYVGDGSDQHIVEALARIVGR